MSKRKKDGASYRKKEQPGPTPEQNFNCCDPSGAENSPASQATDGGGDYVDSISTFMDFMKEANREGLISARSKKLMAISLSIAQRCRPCLLAHIKGAVDMGISKAEISEAANLAIAFSGCAAMMFYNEVLKELKM